jgi:hypothetical protein
MSRKFNFKYKKKIIELFIEFVFKQNQILNNTRYWEKLDLSLNQNEIKMSPQHFS